MKSGNGVIAITMGDPAGVGPELAVKAAANPDLASDVEFIIYGCPDIIRVAGERFAPGHARRWVATGELSFSEDWVGELNAECGVAARNSVIAATRDALDGKIDAIVTTPMNKAAVNMAGIQFTGHTELIAELCGVDEFAMRQSDGPSRVAFVTTHIPIKDISRHVTVERVLKVIRLLRESIIAEGVHDPLIAVAALNPHAGEDGFMGMEEIEVIIPAMDRARELGYRVEGPFPPDTLFIERIRSRFDGIVSMYHDQGHIPFKMLSFDRGVNMTLGLPIIRTSVDHGTAFDIAWRGEADSGSLNAAIQLAANIVKRRIDRGKGR